MHDRGYLKFIHFLRPGTDFSGRRTSDTSVYRALLADTAVAPRYHAKIRIVKKCGHHIRVGKIRKSKVRIG